MHENGSYKLLIERLSAGELDKDDSRRIEEHCKTCPECAGYLESLRHDARCFLALHPFRDFQQHTVSIPHQPWYRIFLNGFRRPSLSPVYGLIAIIFITAPVIYYTYYHHGPQGDPSTPGIRFKGNTSLSFLLKRNGIISHCSPLDTVYPGDEIQVIYSTPRPGFISLVSIDSYGAISWYFPQKDSQFCSIAAKPGGRQVYPAGILLDDSQGKELIVGLLSDKPLSTKTVKKWLTGAIRTSTTELSQVALQLDATKDSIGVIPLTAIFNKGQ